MRGDRLRLGADERFKRRFVGSELIRKPLRDGVPAAGVRLARSCDGTLAAECFDRGAARRLRFHRGDARALELRRRRSQLSARCVQCAVRAVKLRLQIGRNLREDLARFVRRRRELNVECIRRGAHERRRIRNLRLGKAWRRWRARLLAER